MSVTTLVLIALLAVLVFWVVGAYNRLVRLRNRIADTFAQVDVHLRRRYELIPNLVEAAQTHLPHEGSALDAVMAACNQARSASDAVRAKPTRAAPMVALAAAEQALHANLGRLFTLSKSDPRLKADLAMREFGDECTGTETRLAFSRQTYNDAVRDYNHAQGQFPALMVARLFGFAPLAMLPTTQAP